MSRFLDSRISNLYYQPNPGSDSTIELHHPFGATLAMEFSLELLCTDPLPLREDAERQRQSKQ
jgi:hypothetical protein